MKKTFVLVVLFVLPIVAYLFFASGINNFGKLPVLTTNVPELDALDSEEKLSNKISIVGFLGENVELRKTNVLNLNQKIYKRFYEFEDFQMIMIVPKGKEQEVAQIKAEIAKLTDIVKWNFVFADKDAIGAYYQQLKSPFVLSDDYGLDYVFIVDKERQLRGRNDDEDEGVKYGFKATSVAEINKKMVDDVKIILAEYRLALKRTMPQGANSGKKYTYIWVSLIILIFGILVIPKIVSRLASDTVVKSDRMAQMALTKPLDYLITNGKKRSVPSLSLSIKIV